MLIDEYYIVYDNFLSAKHSAFKHFELYLIFLPADIISDAFSLLTDRGAKNR